MEIKAYINDEIGMGLRNSAIKRFGYFKGSLSNAVEEAVIQWIRKNELLEEKLKDLVDKSEKDSNVIAVMLFGSFARKETKYNDIDIAFLLRDPSKEIETLSKYDELDPCVKLDVSCLNTLAVNVKVEVLKDGKVLLLKDKGMLYDFMIKTIKEYNDFRHIYELMLYGRNR